MKKYFFIFLILVFVILSTASCKKSENTNVVPDQKQPSQSIEENEIQLPTSEDKTENGENQPLMSTEDNETQVPASEDEVTDTEQDIPPAQPAVGGSDYTFARKYIDEVYNIQVASEVVGREVRDDWVNNVYLKKSAEEQNLLPDIYQMIVDLKISKEDLIKKNNEFDGIYLSDATIDALYLEDVEAMKQALMSPLALYYNTEIYTFDQISQNPQSIDAPAEILSEYFDKIAEFCEQEGLTKYMQEEIDTARKNTGANTSK